MNAEVLSIGDELLIGQVINTNQAYVAEKLNSVGIPVTRMTTVGDESAEMLAAFQYAWQHFDIVAVTGGLGPTHDDLTRSVVCEFFRTDLVRDDLALENIRRLFKARGLPMTRVNEDQAMVPRGCVVIQNALGTAPGYFFEQQGKIMIIMPGVPYEMTAMMESFVLPRLSQIANKQVIRHRTLKTTGIAESMLSELIGDVSQLFQPNRGITLAYLPSPLGVRLRISVRTHSLEHAGHLIEEVEEKIRAKTKKYIYAVDQEDLEDVVGRILTERGLKIAVAESCTGGHIANRLTNVSGSSAYFERGFVVYSNESKSAELGVSESMMKEHGAVSREVAEAMAEGARTAAKTDIGLSTTGIAGPTGGTPEKPAGLVWVGYSDRNQTIALRFHYPTERRRFKERTAQAALELLRRKLLTIE
ncbi:MAG: competence/damage-inducible protein A [Bacteroidota bacterium]